MPAPEFNAKDWVGEYVTEEEVLEIKKSFDLFDRDMEGSIDPRGIPIIKIRTQNSHQCFGYRG